MWKHASLNSDCHCYSTLASVWVYCCTWSLVCSLGNHTNNQHCPSTYWPGVFEGNDNVSISPILSSSTSSIVSSVAKRLGVSTQDPCAARPEGAGSSWDDPGLILLEAGLKESVTLVPGWASLPPTGLEVAAVSSLQKSVWVLEVTDLELKHPNSTYKLSPERREEGGEERVNSLYCLLINSHSAWKDKYLQFTGFHWHAVTQNHQQSTYELLSRVI